MEAILADHHIGGDQGGPALARLAFDDGKSVVSADRRRELGNLDDVGQGRLFVGKVVDKTVDATPRAFDNQHNAGGRVGHLTGKIVLPGQLVDKWPEADPLHNAVDRQTGRQNWICHGCGGLASIVA